jgi:hypothetical protein
MTTTAPKCESYKLAVPQIFKLWQRFTKGVDFASNGADGAAFALSGGMPIQLSRMRAPGTRGSLPADRGGMGQHGADLASARQSNGSY